MSEKLQLNAKILPSQFSQRLDKVLVSLFPDYSRSQIKKWILNNRVQVNNEYVNSPKKKVVGNEKVLINLVIKKNICTEAENIPLNIVYEDDAILVINKPANLVMHPGIKNLNGTLLNTLLFHYPENINVPRAGIIHRLDKGTTGLIVIAKTITAHSNLSQAIKNRKVIREYDAIVNGLVQCSGIVDQPIARHPSKRIHMAINKIGKPAITHYKIIEKFRIHTRVKLRLETGRTHQIRVHMAHINHHVVGDPVYYGSVRSLKGFSESFIKMLKTFNRQALHAKKLRLYHPITGNLMEWCVEPPRDMLMLIDMLKKNLY
ncbi:23S rRNA pseudouridine(1911/1915/1917) synthase RluD [Arsenophonus symbiont of Ornithomya chloropus]|uniref:23S rRNA pseudouridine(1911/1915/1917) synthase RluD n=1 Tax=Arsenophonus symbiont of Ornithomya chloropus TaxID=634121 RepID=UPI0032B112ED